MPTIDLNADLGESFGPWPLGDDAAMLDVVSSANVACGFHAGDPAGIRDTLARAAARSVTVGAHIGYRDLAGFGRRAMDYAARDLFAETLYQIGALAGLATSVGTRVRYVKPHGALYNSMAIDRTQADPVLEALAGLPEPPALLALAGSPLVEWAADAGLAVYQEAFADRAYTSEGRLVPRSQAGAVLHDRSEVLERMAQLVETGSLESIDGHPTPIEADSICLHGDTPGSVDMARALRAYFQDAGYLLRPFVDRAPVAR